MSEVDDTTFTVRRTFESFHLRIRDEIASPLEFEEMTNLLCYAFSVDSEMAVEYSIRQNHGYQHESEEEKEGQKDPIRGSDSTGRTRDQRDQDYKTYEPKEPPGDKGKSQTSLAVFWGGVEQASSFEVLRITGHRRQYDSLLN